MSLRNQEDNSPQSSSARIARGMIRGTAGFALNRAVDAILGLVMVPYILHRLGNEAFGLWALFYAVVSYFSLADLGFGASLNRHLTTAIANKNQKEKIQVYSTSFFIFAGLSLFLLVIGLAAEPLILKFYPEVNDFGQLGKYVWRSMILILALGYFSNYARALMIASHNTGRLAMIHTLIGLINALMTVFVLSSGWGLFGLAIGSAIFSVVKLLVFYLNGISCVKDWKVNISSVNRVVFNTMWKFGITVQMSRFAEMINQQFDRVFLGRVLGLGSVTNYDLGAKAAASSNLVSQVTLYVIEPAAAAFTTSGDSKHFTELLHRSARYVAMLTLPLGVLLGVMASPMLTFWLGSVPRDQVVRVLQILVAAYIFSTLTQPLRLCARGAGFPGWEARAAFIQAILNILLSIALFYIFGFNGILVGTLLAAFIGQMGFSIFALRGLGQEVGTFLRNSWLGTLLVSLVAGFISWLALNLYGQLQAGSGRLEALPPLIIGGLAFVLVYLLGLVFFKIVTLNEIKDLLMRFRGK